MKESNPIGMYGETPSIQIGKYNLSRQDPEGANESVWVETEQDGSEFSDKLFEKFLDEFYNKHF